MEEREFYRDVISPKLEEIKRLCEQQGYEFQFILAYKMGYMESSYHGIRKFMVPAKLECLRQDLQKNLDCQKNK